MIFLLKLKLLTLYFPLKKIDNEAPVLHNEELLNSLKTTNTYCLQGIENNLKMDVVEEDDDEENDDKLTDRFPGLESVVAVMEEILIWPTRFPKIFEDSPLRNQAGILLFGPPGLSLMLPLCFILHYNKFLIFVFN